MRNTQPNKRELIIQSAIAVFAETGYFNTRVSRIAKNANVADGTIYLYFKTKEEILFAIFDEMMEAFLSKGVSEIQDIECPLEKLKKIIRMHLEIMGGDRNLAKVFQIELRHTAHFMSKISQDKLRKYFELITTVIKEGQVKRMIRPDVNPLFATKFVFGAIDEMATNWVLSPKKYSLKQDAEGIIDILINGLNQR